MEGRRGRSVDVAAELEGLGYTALWSSGGFQPGLSPRFERLLAASTRNEGVQRHREHLVDISGRDRPGGH